MAEQKVDTPSFAVIYYALGGRAQPLRNAAAIGGIAFEDRYLTREQQMKEKAEGKRRWSGPPEVVVFDKDGKELVTIAQSNNCLRYIGKLAGLYPENKVSAALADEILDSCEDVFVMLIGAWAGKETDEEKKAAADELMADDGKLTYWVKKFACRQKEAADRGVKSGLFVGENITIAELKFAATFGFVMSQLPGFGRDGFMGKDEYKPLLNIIDKVNGNDKVKAFEEQFNKNIAAFKEKPETCSFKYGGKTVAGSL